MTAQANFQIGNQKHLTNTNKSQQGMRINFDKLENPALYGKLKNICWYDCYFHVATLSVALKQQGTSTVG